MTAIPAQIRDLPLFSTSPVDTCQLLPEGRTNRNYRVSADGRVYFVRLSAPGHAQHGIDRQKEYAAIQSLHDGGLGPRPIAFYPESQTIVTEFIDAPSWTLEKVKIPAALSLFGQALATMHRLPDNGATYDIAAVAKQYLAELRGGSALSAADLNFLADVQQQVASLLDDADCGMCHNDLWYGNAIDDGTVKIVDLEMAGRGDVYFDLACFIHFHDLDPQQQDTFLSAYSTEPLSRAKLDRMRQAVHLRECLWALTQIEQGFTEPFYTRCSANHLQALRIFPPRPETA